MEKLPNNRIVGAKQTIKAIKTSKTEVVYIAENAEEKVTRPILETCEIHGVKVIVVPTMQKLGELCSIDVGAATACIIKE